MAVTLRKPSVTVLHNGGDVWDFYDFKRQAGSNSAQRLPVVSVITKIDGQIKRGAYSNNFSRARFAVMNPGGGP